MTDEKQPPWASGSREILKHALELLQEDSDTKRRLAMINIDNAVEFMMKTYLGLPKRVTGLTISRREYQEFSESFPRLLDAMEKYAADKLNGVDLGEIEWYHRLRNELYHQGNGLTVERDKVEVYAELANILFANLFGFRLVEPKKEGGKLLRNFLDMWRAFDMYLSIVRLPSGDRIKVPTDAIRLWQDEGVIAPSEVAELDQLRKIRNDIVHANVNYEEVLTPAIYARLAELVKELMERIKKSGSKGEQLKS